MNQPLDPTDLPEARDVYQDMRKKIAVLQSLNSRLLRRIHQAEKTTGARSTPKEGHRHAQLIMTLNSTPSTPHGAQ